VYQRVLALTYVEGLLQRVKATFVEKHYSAKARSTHPFMGGLEPLSLTYLLLPLCLQLRDYSAFAADFDGLLAAAEARAAEEKRARAPPAFGTSPRTGPAAHQGTPAAAPQQPSVLATPQAAGGEAAGADELPAPSTGGGGGGGAFDLSRLSLQKARRGSPADPPSSAKATPQSTGGGDSSRRAPKAKRVWDGATASTASSMLPTAQLDFSEPPPLSDPAQQPLSHAPTSPLGRSAMDAAEQSSSDEEEEEGAGAGGAAADPSAPPKPRGWFAAALRTPALTSVLGKSSLERCDCEPVLEQLKLNLLKKNVASEIADKLCHSVASSLEGRRLGSFTSLGGTVRTAMVAALTRILTPTRSVDILRDVDACVQSGKGPYVVVFVGVNGVGKSTNLAKIAYWLSSNGKKVMIAACDTFRSGAVEQLRTHCTRLGVPLFEKGYAKDPAGVAAEGVRAAAKAGCDVLLVDTAGRMQDNEPLMRALSKLINTNKPHLVLFVGEALVGNDAVDQLAKFNARLADLSDTPGCTRLIDGIVLTKFDTIDDKVGAALSMVYTSGAPVMFVGTGQTYTDLKRFNAKTVVKSLLR